MDFWTKVRVVDEEFAAEVRRFIDENYPPERRGHPFEHAFDKEFNYKFKVWQDEHLEDVTPEQFAAFRQEAARADLDISGRNTTNMVAKVLEALGSEEMKATVVSALRDGSALCSLGYTEPESGSDVAAAKTRAERDGDEWVINGQKMFTSNANIADYVFLLTRSNLNVAKHDGLTMFVVPLDTPGVEMRKIETLSYGHTCMTFYNDVRVPDSARVGDIDGGWKVMRFALDVEHGAGPRRKQSGGSAIAGQQAPVLAPTNSQTGILLSHTINWAKQVQEDGTRPIEDMLTRQRLARLVVRDEVRRLIDGRNDPAFRQAGVGNGNKLYWSELEMRSGQECVDLYGIEGTLSYLEDDAPEGGWADYAFRYCTLHTVAGGCSEVQRDVIAERRLGLPKQRASKNKTAS